MGRPVKTIVLSNENHQRLAKAYRQYLATLGYRPQTVQTKHGELVKFLCWADENHIGNPETIKVHHLESYKAHLEKQPNQNKGGQLSPKTIYSKLRTVELFFIMLQSNGQITANPFGTFKNTYKASTAERTILTQSEIQQLYDTTINHQERAMLSLAYGCGLRAAELEAVNIEDIKLRDGILIVPRGKGNKRRTIPLSPGVKEDLKNYYHNQRPELVSNPDEKAFMVHSKGGRMKDYTWNKYLKRIIERTEDITIQSKGISLHSLRHSIATHLLENGIAVEQVRLFLGHSQLETTETYTRVNQQQLQKLMKPEGFTNTFENQ
jgi:integrase/recombinase XerD